MKYKFERAPADIPAGDAFAAVEAAIGTWQKALKALGIPLIFRKVDASPDVIVQWVPALDSDYPGGMKGIVIAHADYPAECYEITDKPPKPVHFDDYEEKWGIGTVYRAYDIRSVALHEFGHILGLVHDDSGQEAIMNPAFQKTSEAHMLKGLDLEQLADIYK